MAKAFVDAGANVCIIDLNSAAGLALVEEVGDRLAFVEGNVTVEDTWRKALDTCIELFGGVQILVVRLAFVSLAVSATDASSQLLQNNAGVSRKAVR